MATSSTSSSLSELYVGRARCSFKMATALVCTCNLVAALYVLRFLSPVYLFSSSSSFTMPTISFFQRSPYSVRYTRVQLQRVQEALQIWKNAEPVDLINRVEEIRRESPAGDLTDEEMESLREKVVSYLTRRLDEVTAAGNGSQQVQQALEDWRKKQLKDIKVQEEKAKTGVERVNIQREAQAAGLKHLLTVGWSSLLEDIGWVELDSTTELGEDIPSDAEIEGAVIPGRPVPPRCGAEVHMDYDGAAVRWGLTFHVESAADCCQACLDQAKAAKPGQLKCNIWVYCPQEEGCYSPDIYEHKHQECWLKQANKPLINFKRTYSPEYRRSHPTAPVVVPWVSGVISP